MPGSGRPFPLSFRESFAGAEIVLSAARMGNDLAVAVSGGEKPHIGAVAVAQPRSSLSDPSRTSATTSVIALIGHKEDVLARDLASHIAAATDRVVSLSCGIHYDELSADGIAGIAAVVGRLGDRLLQALAQKPPC